MIHRLFVRYMTDLVLKLVPGSQRVSAIVHHTQTVCIAVAVSYKYGLNRYNRRTARGDVPVAKLVQNEEEERIQREHMAHLERQKEV